MKLKQSLVFGSLALLALAGCKKSGDNKPAIKHDTTVYFSGTNFQQAILWKNGVATELPSEEYGTASAITLSGTDVYVSGSFRSAGNILTAVYWKNKTATKLGDGLKSSQGNAIAIAGTDIYVAGTVSPNDVTEAAYWKNGVLTNLASGAYNSSEALGIAINGTDVYVCGNIVKSGGLSEAVYWKNGVLNEITDGSAAANTAANAAAIVVKNNSVHIVYSSAQPNSPISQSYYWKDGISALISNPYASTDVNSLAVDAANVYFAGSAWAGRQYFPMLWKDNNLQDLATTSNYSSTKSIALIGKDIYVAGFDGEPVYWKNGARFKLVKRSDQAFIGISGIAVIGY